MAQTIEGMLYLNKTREYKSGKPQKIIQVIYYSYNEIQINDSFLLSFDAAGRLVYQESKNNLSQHPIKKHTQYDTLRNIVVSVISESEDQPKPFDFYIILYEYDSSGNVIRATHKDGDNKITYVAEITNNELGHPVRMVGIDSNGEQLLVETAIYNYELNRVIVSAYNKAGKQNRSNMLKIDPEKPSADPEVEKKYNEHGDLILFAVQGPDNTSFPHESDYVYDENGNWIEKNNYRIISTGDKKERVLSSVYKRRFIY